MDGFSGFLLQAFGSGFTCFLAIALKGHFEQETLRYKLKKETEFKILKELWQKLYIVKSKANTLRSDRPLPNDDQKREMLADFHAAKEECRNVVYLEKPFYPPEIHRLVNEMLLEAHMEAFSFQHKTPGPEYWDEALENAMRINNFVDEICDSMRLHMYGG